MDNELWCIVGVSSASQDFTVQESEGMLDYSRQDRQLKNITSLVVYADKNALFLIEGTYEAVKSEYSMLLTHTGHHNIIKMFDQSIKYRMFEDYPLAFKSISKDLKALDDFTDEDMQEYFNEFLLMNLPVSKIVKDFIKNNS